MQTRITLATITALYLAVALLVPSCYQASFADMDSDDLDDFYDTASQNITYNYTDTDSTNSDSETPVDAEPGSDPQYHVFGNHCLYLDGAGDYLRVPHSPELNLGEEWTIEAWFLFWEDDPAWLPIIRKGDESVRISSYFLYGAYIDGNPIGGYGTPGGTFVGLRTYDRLDPGVWTHMAVSVDQTHTRLFIDGELVNVKEDNLSKKITDGDLVIGGILHPDELHFFDGMIDEVRISSTARYQWDFVPKMRVEADDKTVALWHFDEGRGETATDDAHGIEGNLVGNAMFTKR